MSLIENVLKPSGFFWLKKSTDAEREPEPREQHDPSLASIEYELLQLRASLEGIMDFDDKPIASRAA